MIDVASTVATLRSIAGVAKEANKIELYQQVLDLQQRIMEAIAENTELVANNAQLTRDLVDVRARLESHERTSRLASELQFRDQMYWKLEGDTILDGPFCPRCKDADQKLIRMTDRDHGFTICVDCKHAIKTPGFVKPPRTVRFSRGDGWDGQF